MRNDVRMGILRRGIAAAFVTAAVALGGGASSAGAADQITADLQCCTFAPGPYLQDLGEVPQFVNPAAADAPHNVTSTSKGPDGSALFRSKTIAAGDSTRVEGTQYLKAGSYPFFCTLHGPSMNGELIVQPSKGTVVARPSIKLSIPSQRLKKVRSSRKVKVKVRAATASAGVRIVVRRGKKAIASSSKIKLAAGSARTLKLKLSRKGRKAISKGRKVSISARGTVDFGKPSAAKRRLR